MLIVNALFMLQASMLAYFTLTNNIDIYKILIISLFGGAVLAVEMPTRQTFVVELVDNKKNGARIYLTVK